MTMTIKGDDLYQVQYLAIPLTHLNDELFLRCCHTLIILQILLYALDLAHRIIRDTKHRTEGDHHSTYLISRKL